MIKDIEQIINQAVLVRDESGESGNTARRVGGTIADLAAYVQSHDTAMKNLEAEYNAIRNLIIAPLNISDIDFDRDKCTELIKLNTTTYYNVYTMLSENMVSVGTMICFSDDMTHVLTQVLFSHYPDLNSGLSHKDSEIYVHYRSFNYKLSTLDIPAYTWSSWKLLTSSESGGGASSVLDIGTFNGINEACNFAARAEVAGNRNAGLIIFHVRTPDPDETLQGQIFQQCMRDDVAMQIRMYDRRLHRRNVTGATGVEGDATNAFAWEEFGAQKLQYDSAVRKLTMKSYENGVIAEVTLPEVTAQNAGLMTGTHLTRLNNTLSSSVGAFDADISATTKNNPVTAKMVGTTVQGGDIVFAWHKLEGMPLIMAGFLYRVGLQYYNISPAASKPIPDKNGLLTNRDKTALYICVNDELVKVIGE